MLQRLVKAKPRSASISLPAYCHHKPSGQAVVYLDRRAVYLGRYDSPESHEAYRRTVAEFGSRASRRLPVIETREPVSIAALVEQYLAYALDYYGEENEYLFTVKAATAPLLELYAATATKDFDGDKLENVRRHRIYQGKKSGRRKPKHGQQPPEFRPISRSYTNRLVNIIVRIFRWAARKKLAPRDLWCELQALESLKKGAFPELPMRECQSVKPVPMKHVEAVLKVVSPEIAAMIQLQLITGMRPDEVTPMRSCDISQTGRLWAYTIGDRAHGSVGHKTDRLEGDKIIYLGKKAQHVLKPFLAMGLQPGDYLFSPQRAAARRYPTGNRGIKPTARYQDDSYCRAVKRACTKANVAVWTPHRLRHNCATEVRRLYGAEGAQAVLNHRSLDTTQIYAAQDDGLKRKIAGKLG